MDSSQAAFLRDFYTKVRGSIRRDRAKGLLVRERKEPVARYDRDRPPEGARFEERNNVERAQPGTDEKNAPIRWKGVERGFVPRVDHPRMRIATS